MLSCVCVETCDDGRSVARRDWSRLLRQLQRSSLRLDWWVSSLLLWRQKQVQRGNRSTSVVTCRHHRYHCFTSLCIDTQLNCVYLWSVGFWQHCADDICSLCHTRLNRNDFFIIHVVHISVSNAWQVLPAVILYLAMLTITVLVSVIDLIMVALCNRADHYIFAL